MIKLFVKSSGLVFAGNVVAKVLSLMTLSMLGRYLGPTTLGLYNAVISTGASINQILDFGSSIVIQKEAASLKPGNELKINTILSFYVFLQTGLVFLIAGVFLFFNKKIISLFFENKVDNYVLIFLVIIVITNLLITVIQQLLLGLGLFKEFAVRVMIVNILSFLSFAGVFIWFGSDLNPALTATILSLIINAGITYFIIFKILKRNNIRVLSQFQIQKYKKNLYDGFVYYIGSTLIGAIVTLSLISLFVNYISVKEFGYMRIGASLSAILGMFISSLQPVTINMLAQSGYDSEKLKSFQLRVVAGILFLVNFIIVLFIDPIIRFLFGEVYLEGSSVIAFMLLMQNAVFIASIVSNFEIASNNISLIGKVSAIGALCNLLLSFLLIPKVGITGFYIAHFVGHISGTFFLVVYNIKKNNYLEKNRIYSNFLFICLGTIISFYLIHIDFLFYKIPLYISAFMVLVFVFYKYILTREERSLSKRLIIRYYRK
ncbi:MAG: oligosaccharide flippase family protein [Saprospiraceae bacterium]|nr:oligosaccharide flippase family protein [Saprospiraceae bacterium]